MTSESETIHHTQNRKQKLKKNNNNLQLVELNKFKITKKKKKRLAQ